MESAVSVPESPKLSTVPGAKEWVAVVVLLVALGCAMVGAMLQESPTSDEVAHVPSGVEYWQKQDTRINLEHPPLLKMIAALPLVITGVRADYNDPSYCSGGGTSCQWLFGKKFFEQWNDARRTILLARVPMMVLTLALGALIYWVGRKLGGTSSGILSLVVFATSPIFLAHGALVTTDVGLALFVLLAMWSFAAVWSRSGVGPVMVCSMATAAAMLSKFSALLLWPSFILFAVWMVVSPVGSESALSEKSEVSFRDRDESGRRLLRGALVVAFACAITFGFYWLTCGHSSVTEIIRERSAQLATYRSPERFLSWTSKILASHPRLEKPLLPFWLYMAGIGYVNAGLTRPTYLLGQHHWHGVWYYFPAVSVFKLTPGEIALLALLVAFAIAAARRAISILTPENRVRVRALVCLLFVFSLASMRSRLNIGIRHFSVPLVVLVVLLALLPLQIKSLLRVREWRTAQGLVFALAATCIVSAAFAYPNYLGYYNWFRFASSKQEIATDSNLDWGQTLPQVEQFRAAHHIDDLYVDNRLSPLEPRLYVSGARKWECDNPSPLAPGWVAVSAGFLTKQTPTCSGLLRFQHWQIAGGSMYVFDVNAAEYGLEARNYRAEHPQIGVVIQAGAAAQVRKAFSDDGHAGSPVLALFRRHSRKEATPR